MTERHNKKSKQSGFTRRRALALGCAGTAGVWLAYSNQYAPRMFRALVADAGRSVVQPRHKPRPETWNANEITAAWLGHSTVLLNFLGLTILTDPVLLTRVGADLGIGTIGPKRLIAPALTAAELPGIDLVLLSHAHMDHLDLPTLKLLPATAKAVTAKATGDLFVGTPMRRATELGWGDKTIVKTRNGEVEVRAFEVRHWGARWRRDTWRGYNGYVLARNGRSVIFGGDTAMTDSFASLHGSRSHDLAIMPIGAYQPWVRSHCTPEQSVKMADAAGAEFFLPIHHQTFKLGQEAAGEPMQRLQAALDPKRLALREIGATFRMS